MAGEDIKNSHRGGLPIKYTKRQSSVKNSFVTKTIQFIETSYVLFGITQEVARQISCYHRHPLLKRLSLG